MNFEFTENGWQDFQYWIETDDTIVAKINDLLNEIKKTPFQCYFLQCRFHYD